MTVLRKTPNLPWTWGVHRVEATASFPCPHVKGPPSHPRPGRHTLTRMEVFQAALDAGCRHKAEAESKQHTFILPRVLGAAEKYTKLVKLDS